MTALNPAPELKVRGVLTSKYETNKTCAHPECDRPAESVHHIFPRSKIGNGSFFVEITEPGTEFRGPKGKHPICNDGNVIPHAVGLCGSGTTGHHGDVEAHRAWIKYEDGVFNWYEREIHDTGPTEWKALGAVNPQPGVKEGTAKRKKREKPETPRPRQVKAIRVPVDALENGVAILEELIQGCREKYAESLGWSDDVPDYYVLTAVLAKDLQS